MSEYVYSAFISYKHDPDEALAGVIQEQIEHFSVPKAYRESALADGKHLKRVFRDSTELTGNFNLEESIKDALSKSAFLIVIISEETKHSTWVLQEIEYFLKDHDRDHILTVLSSGDDPEACYPEKLTRILLEDGTEEVIEPLSVDYRDYQTERGQHNRKNRKVYAREFPRIAAPLLGVSYDDLVKRRERYRKQRIFILVNTALVITSVALVYFIWTEIRVKRNYREAMKRQSQILINNSLEALEENDRTGAIRYALQALPTKEGDPDMPVTPKAEYALSRAVGAYVIPFDPEKETPIRRIELNNGIYKYETDPTGRYVLCVDNDQWLRLDDIEEDRVLYNGSLHEYGRFVDLYVCGGEFYIQTLTGEGWKLYHVAKDGTFQLTLNLSEFLDKSTVYSSIDVMVAGNRIFFLFRPDVQGKKVNVVVYAYSPEENGMSRYDMTIPGNEHTAFDHFRYDPGCDAITFSYYEQDDAFQVIRSGVGVYSPEKNSLKMYDVEPVQIDEYLIEGDRIFYLADLPYEIFGNKGVHFVEYSIKVGCVGMDGKSGWLTKDVRYGDAAEEPIMKEVVIDNKSYVLVGTSDALSVHDAENGEMFRRCEFHSDVKDIWYKDTIGAILEYGELARIELSDPIYTITEAFNIYIENVKRIEDSFTGGSLTFIVDDERDMIIYAEGWGDNSFVPLENASAVSVLGSATHGTLTAVILQEQGYEMCLIDTETMKELWRKPLPEEAFSGVYMEILVDFTEDGSKIHLFNYGLPREEMYEFYYSVEDGSQERVSIRGMEGLIGNRTNCMVIPGYPAYLVHDQERPEQGYRIYRLEEGSFTEYELQLPEEDYENLSTYSSSEDGRFQLLQAERAGKRDILLYDLEQDSCKVLEEISNRNKEDVFNIRVFYSDGKAIICESDARFCCIFDLVTGTQILQIEIPDSSVGSATIHEGYVYLFGYDGYLREYDMKKEKWKRSVRLTNHFEILNQGKWYFDGESILFSFKGEDMERRLFVLDEEELELTEEIGSFVDYIPDTRTFLVNDGKVAFGGFKKHTLDELIEMGYEQLGDH